MKKAQIEAAYLQKQNNQHYQDIKKILEWYEVMVNFHEQVAYNMQTAINTQNLGGKF